MNEEAFKSYETNLEINDEDIPALVNYIIDNNITELVIMYCC